jgi:pimeloyl-ACP methyl ester carboxylesterase
MAPTQAPSTTPPITLDQIFEYTSATHTYAIRWTSLGHPSTPPLVFIHGTPWSSVVWHQFALSLAQSYHVYLFDNPGFGASPLGRPLAEASVTEAQELDADLARQTEVYAALFKSWEKNPQEGWNGRKPGVVAHDHGGLMALRGHLLHNLQYSKLCLIDVVALPSVDGKKKPFFELVSGNREVFEDERWSDGNGRLWEGLVEGYVRDAAYRELSGEVMEELKEPWTERGVEGRRGFVRQLVGAARRDVRGVEARYGEIASNMKVRVIWGRDDRWLPVETAKRLANALGEDVGCVRVIEEAGHLIMYDQPGRLGVELALWAAE